MDEEVGTEGRGGEVIDTAGAVRDVAKNEAVGDRGEDVREDERIHEKAFR
jgi:hypothetical protein